MSGAALVHVDEGDENVRALCLLLRRGDGADVARPLGAAPRSFNTVHPVTHSTALPCSNSIDVSAAEDSLKLRVDAIGFQHLCCLSIRPSLPCSSPSYQQARVTAISRCL